VLNVRRTKTSNGQESLKTKKSEGQNVGSVRPPSQLASKQATAKAENSSTGLITVIELSSGRGFAVFFCS